MADTCFVNDCFIFTRGGSEVLTERRRRTRTGWAIGFKKVDEIKHQRRFDFDTAKPKPVNFEQQSFKRKTNPTMSSIHSSRTEGEGKKEKEINETIIYPSGKLPFSLELDFVLNHPLADLIISILVSLNCLIFALLTIDVGPSLHEAFQSYEQNLSILFVLEYFGRWYGKGLSPRYLLSRGMIIDFIAIAPFGFTSIVTDQSEGLFVRILRLSRILRIQRVVMDTDRSVEIMESMSNVQVRLASIGLSVFSLLYVSAGLFYVVEKDVNPTVLNFFDAFYYSTITLFTVGFGDVTPLTSWGRISMYIYQYIFHHFSYLSDFYCYYELTFNIFVCFQVTVLTVLTGAVLVPYQLTELESVRRLSAKRKMQMEEAEFVRDRTLFGSGASSSDLELKSVFLALNDNDIEVSVVHYAC